MISSDDDAFLMLRKWQNDSHPLKLMLAGDGFRMVFAGRIADIVGTKLAFAADEPWEADAWLELADCRFEYGDSREASLGSISGLKFSSILTIVRPDGIIFMFAEVRT